MSRLPAVSAARGRRYPPLRHPAQAIFSSAPWKATVFHLSSFGLGLFWFVALITLVSVGGSLLFGFIGLPILAFTMWFWITGANWERRRVAPYAGGVISQPYRLTREKGIVARARTRVSDPAVWRDLAYLLLLFPVGIAELVLVATLWGTSVWSITAPVWVWAGGRAAFLGINIDTMAEAWLMFLFSLALAVVSAYAVVGAAHAHGLLARWLLGPNREALLARIDVLSESRSRAVDAALLERQRIERDLHDGAQQRLVALAMGLGMAKEKMESDPAVARVLVDEAHEEAKRAIREIRDLVRGIHPAILSERGLDPAISALAGRCPIPVKVDVDLDRRLPAAIESTAYFVVAEALTNAAKHSHASQVWVNLYLLRDRLVVEVADNGIGGANLEAGSGLAGLRDRVAVLDGRLTIESPGGGPTRIQAELPCGS